MHPDHLGSTSFVTDRDGGLYEHVAYFPYGETWVEQASDTEDIPYLFTGKELDSETGLYYFGARYYDPRTSVWESADPGLPGFLSSQKTFSPRRFNLFGYANGNPIRVSDPNGMDGETKRTVAGVLWQVMPLAGLAFEHSDINPGTLPHAANVAIEATGGMFGPVFEMGVQEAGEASLAADNGNTGAAVFHGYMSYVFFGADAAALVVGGEEALAESGAGKASLADRLVAAGRRLIGGCEGGGCGGPGVCFVGGTLVQTEDGPVPIESIQVGDRVEAGNQECSSDHIDPDAVILDISIPNPEQPLDMIRLQLVRRLSWLEEDGFVDGVGWFELKELNLAGWATVEGIEEAPLEQTGTGCLVLMTVTHVGSEILRLRFEGRDETLELTPPHLMYVESVGWTSARDLRVGDWLRTDSGPVRVAGIEESEPNRRVYNLEVGREHTYRVGRSSLWAHNDYPTMSNGPSGGKPALVGDPWHPDSVAARSGTVARPNGPLAAKGLGYRETNYRSHGQPVYTNGRSYISADVDSHSGGTWKMADSVDNLGSKKTRMGTYNESLERIGD